MFAPVDERAHVLKLQILHLFGLCRRKLRLEINCKSTVFSRGNDFLDFCKNSFDCEVFLALVQLSFFSELDLEVLLKKLELSEKHLIFQSRFYLVTVVTRDV